MKHRFQLYDGLGYLRSYKTRRRAIQAMKSLGRPVGDGAYKLIDTKEKCWSFFKME